jgi:hypothetical protein
MLMFIPKYRTSHVTFCIDFDKATSSEIYKFMQMEFAVVSRDFEHLPSFEKEKGLVRSNSSQAKGEITERVRNYCCSF